MAGGTQQFAKRKCKESGANRVLSHDISRILLHHKYIHMHHERRCTNVLSIWIQDYLLSLVARLQIATRLLAALVSTSSILTSTNTTSTDLRPINFNPWMGHTKTSFVWQESLFSKNFNPKCVASV
jgi:hypothetical protein